MSTSAQAWAAFLEARAGLPRQGPGLPEDVHWALDQTGVSGAVHVLDAGCGPGDDTVTLARALPMARITAVDTAELFVREAQARVAEFGDRVQVQVGSMADVTGPFDLIWCAGALYFLGVTEGLGVLRNSLAPGGHIVFSEPVALGPLSQTAQAFWAGYPQLTDLAGIKQRARAANCIVHDHRIIVGQAWQAYYDPLAARTEALGRASIDPMVLAAASDNQTEINRWRACPDEIAYALLIVSPE